MATITIKYTEPTVPASPVVLPVCRLFEPNNSYIDSDPYAGTVYDTNVDGFGTWEGLAKYLSKVTNNPNVFIMFKAAVKAAQEAEEGTGSVEFEEQDPKMVEYYKELGLTLTEQGFVVEVADGAAADDGAEEGTDEGVTE